MTEASLVLALHVQPGAKQTGFAGRHGDAIKVRLAAPPVDGKANEALLRFLAEAFGVPLRNVTLLHGAASRRKHVRIDAPAQRPDLDANSVKTGPGSISNRGPPRSRPGGDP